MLLILLVLDSVVAVGVSFVVDVGVGVSARACTGDASFVAYVLLMVVLVPPTCRIWVTCP